MFGQAPGGMWHPSLSASGGGGAPPPQATNGVPFNSLYLQQAQQAQAAHHLGQFVQPYPQHLMQAQTAQQHAALAAQSARQAAMTGGAAGARAQQSAAMTGAQAVGQMMPPGNNLRTLELQEKRKAARDKLRAEEERKKAAEKAKEELFTGDLFKCEPQKIRNDDDQVSHLLFVAYKTYKVFRGPGAAL